MKLTAAILALALAPIALAAQMPAPHNTDHDAAAMPSKPPVPPSHSLTVTFEGHTTAFKIEDLLALPQVTVHVHNAHRNTDETYSGPLLADVLARAGLVASRETEPLILHSSVIATGTDHYFVLYSAAEVEPMFSRSQVIVAVMKSGLPDTEGGMIQLINTDGAKPARWVHGLTDLNVMSISPTAH
ncbi:MAG TPA: hypothetical protein VHY48_06890 [Acidobacteriaceae bacterium]|jgi:hypothetical protein|nr:hypothetical protein [Acidobacteriaceae bacterium]